MTEFLTTFKEAYLRNNRRGGQKNLRCFPECSERGHSCSGFCGRAVQVNFVPNCAGCTEKKEILSLAEFVTNGKEPTDIVVGSSFPVGVFESDTRDKKNSLRRFVRGLKNEDGIFNYKPSCWHYRWRSNKHATDTLHFLRVVTFEIDRVTSTMTCVSLIDSTKFTLFSIKMLDKTTNKRKITTVTKKIKKRPAKRLKRSAITVQEPKSERLSNLPTEEMDAWSHMCPPSPDSVTFFEDDGALMADTASLSLDALLLKLDTFEPVRRSMLVSTPPPTLSEFSLFDTHKIFDNHSSLPFKFDPMLDVFCFA